MDTGLKRKQVNTKALNECLRVYKTSFALFFDALIYQPSELHKVAYSKGVNGCVSAAATDHDDSRQKLPLIFAALAVGCKRLLGARTLLRFCFHEVLNGDLISYIFTHAITVYILKVNFDE